MIYIKNRSLVNLDRLVNMLKKFQLKVVIDKDSIEREHERLLDIDTRNKPSSYEKNVVTVLNELESNLYWLNCVNAKEVEIRYAIIDNNIDTSPIKIRDIPLFNIQATDFMKLDNFTLINVDFTELITGLALSYASEDLAIDINTIEETFGNDGFSRDLDMKKFIELVGEDATYNSVRGFRIGDCPYVSPDHKEVIDYYQEVLEFPSDGYYRSVVASNSFKTIRFILGETLDKLMPFSNKVAIASIGETGFKVLVYSTEDTIINTVIDIINSPVSIEMFGRSFISKPSIEIIRGVKNE